MVSFIGSTNTNFAKIFKRCDLVYEKSAFKWKPYFERQLLKENKWIINIGGQ